MQTYSLKAARELVQETKAAFGKNASMQSEAQHVLHPLLSHETTDKDVDNAKSHL